MNIVIVDDNEDSRIILKKILEAQGWSVEMATNGEEALKMAKASPPEMIISDILMPVMDGFQLCRKLRSDPALRETPFVFYTATYTDEKDRELALKVGADEYMVKPTDPDEFIGAIKGVFHDKAVRKTGGEPPAVLEEEDILKLYNERLVKKLEKKMLYLEREVAERKRVEKRRAQSEEAVLRGEEFSRRMIESSNDCIKTLDLDGRLEFMSEGGQNLLEIEDIGVYLNQSWVDFWQEPDRKAVLEAIRTAKEGGAGSFQAYSPTEKGNPKWWDVIITPITGKDGKAERLLVVSRDITTRIQAKETLQKSEEKYRTLVESSTDAILLLDRKRRIVSFNRAFQDLFGYEKNEVEGQSIKIIHKSDESFRSFEKIAYSKVKSSGHFMGEWEFVRKDGTILPAAETVTSVIKSSDGTTTGYVAVLRDITERKQRQEENLKFEAQLQQAQKREAIGTLAGGIAHDFNNILAAIIGYSELAMMEPQEGSEVMANLGEVLQAGKRAKALVQQILTVIRRHKLERQPLQLRYLVKEVLELLRATLPTTIEIRQDLAGDAGIVNADPNQIHQVLVNLCTNAGHAMEADGGVLTVALENVELDELSASPYPDLNAGPYLRLTVGDTGHGIPPEILEQIFDPYFTTKDVGEGTGLGLSVAHGIVKSHGGAIKVYSEPGKGSTFQVYLPMVEETEKPRSESEKPIPTGNERILFIDDEPPLANLGKQMLKHLGYEAVSLTSSMEALERFKAQPEAFDLVFTDMTMPHMTGDKLAQELIKIRSDIPIILSTGHSKQISEEMTKEMGIRAFVMKPVSKRTMAETVRRVLDGGKPMTR